MLHIALPVMDEEPALPALLECFEQQDYDPKRLWVCVNQPDDWWNDPEKIAVCQANEAVLRRLGGADPDRIVVIDRSSPGKGWKGRKQGVGWARKVLMDKISTIAGPDDIIVSWDADTQYPGDYLSRLAGLHSRLPVGAGLALPYCHPLTGNDENDRALLRYELYLRMFFINMKRTGSPYAFTALGSAISLPVSTYRAVKGITPNPAGEDFYLLQKLAKYRGVFTPPEPVVKPSGRMSPRVPFGTGPAVAGGIKGEWSAYPLFHPAIFEQLRSLLELFPRLYEQDLPSPADGFFTARQITPPWKELRANYKSRQQFVSACHRWFDGLKSFQFLRWLQQQGRYSDAEALRVFFELMDSKKCFSGNIPYGITPPHKLSLEELKYLRERLWQWETEFRQTEDD
ncbi:MAG: hypothetical protein Kow00127_25340 [Bacteroidales bacterium]